jgi:hypothetical protein
MSATITTKELVYEVRTGAKVWKRILDCMIETRANGKWEDEKALQTIQRNLVADLAEIGRLVAAGNLKESNNQAGMLMMRCDVTLQSETIRGTRELGKSNSGHLGVE